MAIRSEREGDFIPCSLGFSDRNWINWFRAPVRSPIMGFRLILARFLLLLGFLPISSQDTGKRRIGRSRSMKARAVHISRESVRITTGECLRRDALMRRTTVDQADTHRSPPKARRRPHGGHRQRLGGGKAAMQTMVSHRLQFLNCIRRKEMGKERLNKSLHFARR
ncbi:hypothetical protein PHJA_001566400 [Phtheirospermum japonicum]|uniref:Uncharacterized protein n=1 Tax=Phtheirospermum japonicum TaxID=374723 RepID=A0A830C558_9LAMI|nr:hypothetical protein PHJA_001566400 [Phtheirospermum japonicum]